MRVKLGLLLVVIAALLSMLVWAYRAYLTSGRARVTNQRLLRKDLDNVSEAKTALKKVNRVSLAKTRI